MTFLIPPIILLGNKGRYKPKKDKETKVELLKRIKNIELLFKDAVSKADYYNYKADKYRKQLKTMYEKLALYEED